MDAYLCFVTDLDFKCCASLSAFVLGSLISLHCCQDSQEDFTSLKVLFWWSVSKMVLKLEAVFHHSVSCGNCLC